MRTIRWSCILVTVAVAGLSAGCADFSRASQAEALRADLTDLPGVASVKLNYAKPVPLDSGKLQLHVKMSEPADTDQVVEVAETAYHAFRSTHHGEEADLVVRAGRTSVALRSFEPDASTDAVGDAVRTGLMAAPEDASVTVDLTTQEVSRGDHVAGTYLVTLPAGSTSAEIPELLTSLAARNPENAQIGWGVAAADGSSLSYDSGFPPAEVLSRWEELQRTDLSLTLQAFKDGALVAEDRLSRRYDVENPAERRALGRIAHPQLRTLGAGEWIYTLRGPRGAALAEIDRYICNPVSHGTYDDELEAWATEQFGPCPAE